jgi:hypothetical protein
MTGNCSAIPAPLESLPFGKDTFTRSPQSTCSSGLTGRGYLRPEPRHLAGLGLSSGGTQGGFPYHPFAFSGQE